MKVKEEYGNDYSTVGWDLIVYTNKQKSPSINFQVDEGTVFSFAVVDEKIQN